MSTPIEQSALYRAVHRQPADWRALLRRDPARLDAAASHLGAARRIVLAGIGTSHHAAQLGAAWLRAAGRDASAVQSADFATYHYPLDANDAFIVISHRGTKRYSLQALERARGVGAWCLGITGQESPLEGIDLVLHTVQQEESSTHSASYTGALFVLALLAARLGNRTFGALLERLPDQLDQVLAEGSLLRDWVHQASIGVRITYAGGGLNGWTALEGALKAKEAAYVTAEGMALETLLHGPLVGLDRGDQLVLINAAGPFEARSAEIARAAREIGLDILWVGKPPAGRAPGPGLTLPDVPELLSPFLATPPLQLLAAFLAERRGTNPDSFRLDVQDYERALAPIAL